MEIKGDGERNRGWGGIHKWKPGGEKMTAEGEEEEERGREVSRWRWTWFMAAIRFRGFNCCLYFPSDKDDGWTYSARLSPSVSNTNIMAALALAMAHFKLVMMETPQRTSAAFIQLFGGTRRQDVFIPNTINTPAAAKQKLPAMQQKAQLVFQTSPFLCDGGMERNGKEEEEKSLLMFESWQMLCVKWRFIFMFDLGSSSRRARFTVHTNTHHRAAAAMQVSSDPPGSQRLLPAQPQEERRGASSWNLIQVCDTAHGPVGSLDGPPSLSHTGNSLVTSNRFQTSFQRFNGNYCTSTLLSNPFMYFNSFVFVAFFLWNELKPLCVRLKTCIFIPVQKIFLNLDLKKRCHVWILSTLLRMCLQPCFNYLSTIIFHTSLSFFLHFSLFIRQRLADGEVDRSLLFFLDCRTTFFGWQRSDVAFISRLKSADYWAGTSAVSPDGSFPALTAACFGRWYPCHHQTLQ